MTSTSFLRLSSALVLSLALASCSTSKRQNPVGSNEEVGKVADSFEDEKPATYTAKEGDTLKKIAGRPEVYGDPNLWPVLQQANADKLGQGTRVNKGTVLKIPRDLSQDQIDEAREKARQAAAASKMGGGKPRPKPKKAVENEVSFKQEKPKVKASSQAKAEARPTPVLAQPVPKAKKGGMLVPVLLVLLLILAALAVVLYYFMKKDGQDEPKD